MKDKYIWTFVLLSIKEDKCINKDIIIDEYDYLIARKKINDFIKETDYVIINLFFNIWKNND